MGQDVDTRSRAQSLRHCLYQIRVDNRHRRSQRIIRYRVLNALMVIGNNGERRYFRTRARRSRDSDHHSLFAQLRKFKNTFADIHKAHRQIFKFQFRMFVHQPHNLARVNRRTAAQRNDNVRLKRTERTDSHIDRRQIRIRMHVGEYFVRNADFVQNIGNFLGIAQIKQRLVGNDKRAFFAFQFLKSKRQRTRLKVNFRRNSEPQHIFFAFHYVFDIHQMFYSYVFADRVAAPGAAAQSQRRFKPKVVNVADSALRRRAVNHHAPRNHQVAEIFNPVVVLRIGIKHRSVPLAAVRYQSLRQICAALEIVGLIHCQNRRQLFG